MLGQDHNLHQRGRENNLAPKFKCISEKVQIWGLFDLNKHGANAYDGLVF